MAFLKTLSKNRFLRYGLPFISLLVVGSFGLQHFTQLRYLYRRKKTITEQEAEAIGVKMKPEEERPTLEHEYEKLQQADLDTWQNIRGPRPWENSKEVQGLLRQEQKNEDVPSGAPT